jgi:hypothetical protein
MNSQPKYFCRNSVDARIFCNNSAETAQKFNRKLDVCRVSTDFFLVGLEHPGKMKAKEIELRTTRRFKRKDDRVIRVSNDHH